MDIHAKLQSLDFVGNVAYIAILITIVSWLGLVLYTGGLLFSDLRDLRLERSSTEKP